MASVFALPVAAEPDKMSPAAVRETTGSELYVLSFNRWGNLATIAEREQIIDALTEGPPVDQIVVFSYGWANDGELSYGIYRELVDEIEDKAPARPNGRAIIIAIGWDSSLSGFRKLFNDLIPLPVIADALALAPDAALFPVSFWSKAAMADRIGFGGLRVELNQILDAAYPDGTGIPDFFLIGHSFGTRVLSGLMQEDFGPIPVRSKPFSAADQVRGAVLMQPALVAANLHHDANYPILVTQSRHDHANGLMYPIANLVLNSFAFTASEATIGHQVDFVTSTVGGTLSRVSDLTEDVTGLPVPGGRTSPEDVESEASEEERGQIARALFLLKRSMVELASVPIGIAFTVVATPVDYAYTQVRGLRHPVDHVMNTLAQLPIVEAPVHGLGEAIGRDVPWGSRDKGFFNLGALHEAVGRASTRGIWLSEVPTVVTLEGLIEARNTAPCGLPACKGVIALDASNIVSEGIFGLDLNYWTADFTVGWLDPIGSHSDYRGAEVIGLIAQMMRGGHARPKVVSAPE